MLISEFFENQEIFITGGSGFIGKALIEKLLFSCPGISKIFVLLRDKRGKSAQERLNDILKTPTFDRLRKEPEVFQKIEAISGDCAELGLGIHFAEMEKLQNVSIIYHSAASVRFDDELRDAILLNTRGTYEVLKIAEKLPKLKAFMHVSTTYCNPYIHVVEEKIYPPYADWRTTIKLAETYDVEILSILNPKYSDFQPNTYTFTKSLAEHIVNDHKDKLPVVIFRPSIVISSIAEPTPGWIDNFNGPVGMLVACGLGIMRTNYADPDIVSDFVPVDIVVRALLIAAYKKGYLDTKKNEQRNNEVDVINCATATLCPLSLGEIIEMGKIIVRNNPIDKTLWVPGGSITRCRVWNFLRFLLWHIMMALFVDLALRLSKRKPLLLKLQRRIFHASTALHYFMTTSWLFKNENFFELDTLVPKPEFRTFSFLQYATLNYECFLYDAIRGAKRFLLKESPESSPGARLRMRIYDKLNFLFEILGILLIVFLIFYYFRSKLY